MQQNSVIWTYRKQIVSSSGHFSGGTGVVSL
jgi:hypothetical protein